MMNAGRLIKFIVIVGILCLIISFFIPKETKPSDSTRVILDHHVETYIAPICFEEANASNFLDETTLKQAQEMNYEANSDCTKEALKDRKSTRLNSSHVSIS